MRAEPLWRIFLTASATWAAGLLAALLFVGSVAAAATVCGPHEAVLEGLARTGHEERRGLGVGDDGWLYELLVGPETWTLLKTDPKGRTCFVMIGTLWQGVPQGTPA